MDRVSSVMIFEVFIPSHDPEGFDVSLRVEARNWMEALRLGLQRTYSVDMPVRNVFCDIRSDDLIHVTDLASRRVFRIERVGDAPTTAPRERFRHPQEFPAVDARLQASWAEVEPPRSPSGEVLGFRDSSGRLRAIGGRAFDPALAAPEASLRVVEESVTPTQRFEALRPVRNQEIPPSAELAESTMERVFLEVAGIAAGGAGSTLEQTVSFALDLAMRSVPADAGSVLFTDESGTFLYFAAARGPKADELLAAGYRVPLDQGLVGFCARVGVSLAVSDAGDDPRFFRDISEQLGYPTRSVLCAPIESAGRAFGVIELLNRRDGASFATSQLAVLTYIAEQLGRYLESRGVD
jgi:hypothetical protein